MKRLMHIGLLLMALFGVLGQSTAMAMMPASGAVMSSQQSFQLSMTGMDCMDMAHKTAPGTTPCKKVTLQCMATMGCASFALVAPSSLSTVALVADPDVSTLPLAARLLGRTYGPEPDPPSFLI